MSARVKSQTQLKTGGKDQSDAHQEESIIYNPYKVRDTIKTAGNQDFKKYRFATKEIYV